MENAGERTHRLPRRAKGFRIEAELRLAPSNKGIGVFAAQFIPANTRVDDHHYIYFDEQQTLKFLARLQNDEERKAWLDHSFGKDGMIAVHDANLDEGGMVNHSDYPTMATSREDGHTYTTRDVREGEELTEDYDTYDKVNFYEKLCEKYGAVDWFIKKDISNNDAPAANGKIISRDKSVTT